MPRSRDIPRLILIGLGLFLLGVTGLLLWRYRLALEPVDGAFTLAAAAATIAVFAMAWIRPAWRANAALLSVTVVGSVFALEVALAAAVIFDLGGVRPALREDLGDARQDLMAELRAEGVEAYPTVFPRGLMHQPTFRHRTDLLPLGGISDVVTVHCHDPETGWNLYTSDERGFRNPRGLVTGDSVELAVIGDSFTHGACVPTDSNYVERLREHWPATLNLGAGGNGPLAELAGLREYLRPLRPPVVLWAYYEGNDLENLDHEREDEVLGEYVDPEYSQDLRNRQPEIDSLLIDWLADQRGIEASRPSFKVRVLSLYHLRRILTNQSAYGRATDAELELFASILTQARDEVEGWGGRLHFVYIPEWARFHTDVTTTGMSYRPRILALADSLGLPVIDITPHLTGRTDLADLYQGADQQSSHFNSRGYGVVADIIAGELRARP